MNLTQSVPAMSSQQHLTQCLILCSFFLTPWHSLGCLYLLITPYPSPLRAAPLPPTPAKMVPSGPASLPMPSDCQYMPKDLSYACASNYQPMTSRSFSATQMSLLHSQAYTPMPTGILIWINHRRLNFTRSITAHHLPPHLVLFARSLI